MAIKRYQALYITTLDEPSESLVMSITTPASGGPFPFRIRYSLDVEVDGAIFGVILSKATDIVGGSNPYLLNRDLSDTTSPSCSVKRNPTYSLVGDSLWAGGLKGDLESPVFLLDSDTSYLVYFTYNGSVDCGLDLIFEWAEGGYNLDFSTDQLEGKIDDIANATSKIDDLQSDIDGIELSLIDIDTQLDDINTKLDDIQGAGFDTSVDSLVKQTALHADTIFEVNENEALLTDIQGVGFDTGSDSLKQIRDRVDEVMVATGTPVGYSPTSATRTIGSDEGGTVTDLAAHDDSSMVTGEDASTGLEVDIVRSTSVVTETPAVLRITGYYDGSPSHQLNVSVYNYTTSAYEQVGVMIDRSAAFDYSFPLSSDHQDPSIGEMKFKIKHAVSSYFASHRLYLDFVGWEKVESNSAILSDLAAIRAKTDQTNFSMGNILARNESGNKIAEDSTVAKSGGTKGTDALYDIVYPMNQTVNGINMVLDSMTADVGYIKDKVDVISLNIDLILTAIGDIATQLGNIFTAIGNLMTKTTLANNLKLIMYWLRRPYKDDIIE